MKKIYKSLFGVILSSGMISSLNAQTTVTITAIGATGSYVTGSVNSAGVKNDGDMINITSTANAGWAKFDVSSLPVSAVITNVLCAFTTYSTTSSAASNNLFGFVGDPAIIAGTTLYTNCNTGTSLNLTSWTANAANTKTLNSAGITFVQNNKSSNSLCIGYSRASTNNYNIAGYSGIKGPSPQIIITYTIPPICSGMPTAGTAVASNTLLCAPQNVNLSLSGTTVASGLSFQWLSSPNGSTWSAISTATNAATTQSVTATTYYQCAVSCGTNVASSNTIIVNYGTTPLGGNTISSQTLICSPQNVNLSLSGSSATSGLLYQWQSSPNGSTWTSITSATLATSTQSVTGTTYFQNILTCATNTAVSNSVQINIAPTTTNTVPYFEGFEGITLNNQLPNCSWAASNLPTICQTNTVSGTNNRIPKTGTKFADFRWGTATTGDYFYTNGIQLTAGTNYIASADYVTDGAAGWSEFSLLVGSSQSTVGLVNIASLTGALTNTVYANLNGTFSVSATGIYYMAIKGIGNGTPWYLSFDDVKVSVAPTCSVAPFAGTISGPVNVNSGSINSYSISPSTGNVQWYTGSSLTGPWSPIGSATLATNQTITAVGSGTVYYTVIASTLGCPNDTANIPLAVNVVFPGNNVCSAIPLSIGTSTVYDLFGASVQAGEVAPPSAGCSVNNGWCNSTINNTMWFTFVAPASGNVSVQSPGFDSQLAIWSATNCANLIGQSTPTAPVGATLVAANDDDANYIANGGAQFSSYVRAACLTPGATYYIQLDSYSAAASSLTTTIIITDLGVMNTSFAGLAPSYCLPAASSSLTPVTMGGLFTVDGGTTTVTSYTPSSVGSHTVTYSIFGCVSNSVTVVANTPTVMAMSSSSAICAGASATLTGSGASSYTWSPSLSLSSTNNTVVTASPTSPTTYTLLGSNGTCSNTTSVSLNVNSNPSVMATSSSSAICAGASATLTGSGATNYTWSPIGGNSTTAVVSPTVNTTYTLTGESLGCIGNGTVNLAINSIPVISISPASTTVCPGITTTLTASGSTTYTWSNAANTATVAVTPTATAIYTVTSASSCGTSSATVSVYVSSTITVNASTSSTLLCSGQSATLTANGATNYTWMPSNATGATIVVTPTTTITYSVMGASSCGTASATVTQNVSLCTGIIETLTYSHVNLYPNPNFGIVTIELSSELTENVSIAIIDALGKIVISEKLTTKSTTINTSHLDNGVYFYKITSNNKDVKIGKLVKQ